MVNVGTDRNIIGRNGLSFLLVFESVAINLFRSKRSQHLARCPLLPFFLVHSICTSLYVPRGEVQFHPVLGLSNFSGQSTGQVWISSSGGRSRPRFIAGFLPSVPPRVIASFRSRSPTRVWQSADIVGAMTSRGAPRLSIRKVRGMVGSFWKPHTHFTYHHQATECQKR